MIECAYYTIGVIEVQYSQIDYVQCTHIYIHHQTTNHKPISFDRNHAAIPKNGQTFTSHIVRAFTIFCAACFLILGNVKSRESRWERVSRLH